MVTFDLKENARLSSDEIKIIEEAKKMGTNYITILGMLLDKAVDEYKIL